MALLDPYSVVSVPLFPHFRDRHLGTATGFFYKSADAMYLVSNWHVFSGRHPENGQPLDQQTGAIPDCLRMHLHGNCFGSFRKNFHVPVTNENGEPLWRQHQAKGQQIDVGVLQIQPFDGSLDVKLYCVNDEPEDLLLTRVGTDVFIVGFPKGLALQEILPIWKRGTIATETDIPIDGMPIFLVDSATREGMSGSPVYARSVGFAQLEQGNSEVSSGKLYTRFLGVYSGRYGADDEFAAQVGRVWKRELIDEIISDGTPGQFLIK